MIAYVFPGQGAQFEGMGLNLYESNKEAKSLFELSDEILGFKISEIMFRGSADDLRQTKVTQPALFIHALATMKAKNENRKFDAVAGHSLGEFSALVANGTLRFEDGLKLVSTRAMAMQAACESTPGTMAAILGLEDKIVEDICADIDDVVVAANYNCPGQLVISGSISGIDTAIEKLTLAGAKRALKLEVGGAFHSPLMASAKSELATAIAHTTFYHPTCPIYQNVTAKASSDPVIIQQNLIDQLTGPVKWTQTVENMIADGMLSFVEVGGNGKVLSGLIKKVDRNTVVNPL